MDRISELPPDILETILYILYKDASYEAAVRTSVLSKSWRYIWRSLPVLGFSDTNFKGNKKEFISVVKRTLKRYRDQKLRLEEFRLSISLGAYFCPESVSLLEKLIPRLTNMGVKVSRLTIRLEYLARVELPPVVFEAESLQDLHVGRFELDQKAIQRILPYNNLKNLSLHRVSVKDEIFQKIISCCPLIESMHVEVCKRLRTIRLDDLHNLKRFYFSGGICGITIDPPSLETITISSGNLSFPEGADFRNLSRLSLLSAELSWDHLSSCNFPNLRFLEITDYKGLTDSQLVIDAPNINRFQYRGSLVPSISFATTSNKWESFIYLTYPDCNDNDRSSWILKLKELLESLSQSEVYLTLTIRQSQRWDVIPQNIPIQSTDDGGNKTAVVVENLSLIRPLSSVSSFINCVSGICRPRNIGNYININIADREWIEFWWKILMERQIVKQDEFLLLWFPHLEEVRMEMKKYEKDNRNEWQSITLSELPKYEENFHYIRFALKWRG